MARFTGFSPKAISFFRQLEKNNSRDWFTPRKELFEELVRQPMLQLVKLVSDQMRGFALDHVVDPGKALFRIYRDTRFSKDKSPYKTQIAANFPRRGLPKYAAAGFYFSVSHAGVEVAGGMYMPGPQQLSAVRGAIADAHETFRKVVTARPLRTRLGELQGEKLARVPRGFAPDHPAAEFLRMKQFYFYKALPPKSATVPGLERQICASFRTLVPFVEFINGAILQKLREDEGETIPKRPEPMF